VIQQIFVFTKSCHSLIFFTMFKETDIDVCTAFTISSYSLRKRLNLISFLVNFNLPINIFKICFQNFTYKMSRQTKNVILEIVPHNDSTVFGIERRVRDEVKPNPKTVFPIILKKRVSLLPGFKCCFSKIILFLQ
jgi:hypothetical protein